MLDGPGTCWKKSASMKSTQGVRPGTTVSFVSKKTPAYVQFMRGPRRLGDVSSRAWPARVGRVLNNADLKPPFPPAVARRPLL